MFNNFFFENRVVYVEECGTAGQATHDNRIRIMRFAFWITKTTYTQNM